MFLEVEIKLRIWCLCGCNFFPNSNSFGVFSHRQGLGAESLSDSLWFWGRSVLGRHKVLRKVPPIPLQFQQGFNRGVSGPLGQTGLGLSKGSAFSRLTHTPPVRRKRPIMSLLLGYSLGLFNGIIRNNVSLFYS